MAMTTIRVNGIEALGRHGVFDEEKITPQRFSVDLECVVKRPGADELASTVDYCELAGMAAGIVAGNSVDLIETLAERIATACLAFDGVVRVAATVHKLDAPLPVTVADVSATVILEQPGKETI